MKELKQHNAHMMKMYEKNAEFRRDVVNKICPYCKAVLRSSGKYEAECPECHRRFFLNENVNL